MLNVFMLLGLLRLTNFNFYVSKLLGFHTEINNLGGSAFNFINYIGIAALGIVIVGKFGWLKVSWSSAWPIFLLLAIYLFNALMAPYTNYSWVLYQCLFLVVALVLHFITLKSADQFHLRFEYGMRLFFWLAFSFVLTMLLVILMQLPLSTYLFEFNDSFVQSLDDYGVMKQRHGYLIGFLLSYAIFMLRKGPVQWIVIGLLLLSGIGIRSLLIGVVGGGLVFTMTNTKYFIGFVTVIGLAFYFLLGQYFSLLIYDTRFYSFLNAYDIIQNFPFGVGLGGYPVYTEIFSQQLFGNFYNAQALLDFVPIAPESDLVHLFGSLGFGLACVHLLVIGRLIWYSYRLQSQMNAWHKYILFYFCYMTFFGISEDSIFSINYWIFFGIASGIISYLIRSKFNTSFSNHFSEGYE